MSQLLASVTNVEEALLALENGADIIDLKNPAEGALGALSLGMIRAIVDSVARHKPLSATIGDLPMDPRLLLEAARETADTGVDIVKIGFFGREAHVECIHAMQALTAQGARMVAVLFADEEPDFGLLAQLEAAGFYGVMLDTAIKNGKRLRHHMGDARLRCFVEEARSRNLLTGLAGSLAITDIADLVQLDADYLGFRGALCASSDRKAALDPRQLALVADVLHSCNTMAKEFA
jgi:uncharacterized protein (UPF0264 family)